MWSLHRLQFLHYEPQLVVLHTLESWQSDNIVNTQIKRKMKEIRLHSVWVTSEMAGGPRWSFKWITVVGKTVEQVDYRLPMSMTMYRPGCRA